MTQNPYRTPILWNPIVLMFIGLLIYIGGLWMSYRIGNARGYASGAIRMRQSMQVDVRTQEDRAGVIASELDGCRDDLNSLTSRESLAMDVR